MKSSGYILLSSLFFLPYLCMAQRKTLDTAGYVLMGNTILEGSSKNRHCSFLGFNLVDFAMLDCGSGVSENGADTISSVKVTDSTIFVKISIEANCCSNVLADMEVVGDTILNIIYHDYGDLCVCNCSFCLDYTVKYSPRRIANVRRWYPVDIKYLMINNNPKTLFYVKPYIKL